MLILCGKEFKTQQDLRDHVNQIFENSVKYNEFLMELSRFHPRIVEKCNGRIIESWEMTEDNRGINMIFTNGEREKISWNRAIKEAFNQNDLPQEDSIKCALRTEILEQLSDFRKINYPNQNNKIIHVKYDGLNFVDLVNCFLKEYTITPLELRVEKLGNDKYLLRNNRIGDLWRAFHKEHAVLCMEPSKGKKIKKKKFWT